MSAFVGYHIVVCTLMFAISFVVLFQGLPIPEVDYLYRPNTFVYG